MYAPTDPISSWWERLLPFFFTLAFAAMLAVAWLDQEFLGVLRYVGW